MAMHIAFITPEYPHEKVIHAAGIGTSIKNLAIALHAEKIQVSVFVYSQENGEVINDNGIKIHLIKKRKYKFATWYFYRKHIQNYINEAVVRDKINIIEAPDWTGITAFMNLKAPLVIRLHGSDAYFCRLEKRKQKMKNFWFEKRAISNADAIVSPTDFAANLTKEIFNIKKKIETVPNGISLKDFDNPQPEVFEQGLILYVGTLIRKKGVLELPEIMKKVIQKCPSARLVLIGSDSFDIQTASKSTWKLLQNCLDEKNANSVTYLGKVPYASVREYIKKANICVFPTFAETLGMVTIESMAMNKAVVNSNLGWARELIDDEKNGFLVDPKNHECFAQKIITVLEDDILCVQLGKEARKKAQEKFDIGKIALKNIAFYKDQLLRAAI